MRPESRQCCITPLSRWGRSLPGQRDAFPGLGATSAPSRRRPGVVRKTSPDVGWSLEWPLDRRSATGTSPARAVGVARARATAIVSARTPTVFPDPASRFQPRGPHGPSQIVDPRTFAVDRCRLARRASCAGQVLYEMHIGTFTEEGTWQAALEQLPRLATLGITTIEMMPVAEFRRAVRLGLRRRRSVRPEPSLRHAGRFAPVRRSRARARPRRHSRRRLQPFRSGRQLSCAQFSPRLFHRPLQQRMGRGDQLRRRRRRPVREFFVANAGYWIDEFHLDGLRFDATQQIFDASPDHILAEMSHARARGRRRPLDPPDRGERAAGRAARCGRSSSGGYGLDALWNDDFHHARHGRADRPPRGLLHRLSAARRRSSSRSRSGDFSIRGSATRGRRQRRGTPTLGFAPAAVRHLPAESRSDRQCAAGRGERVHAADEPRLLSRDDGALAAVARHADALSGPGVRRLVAVPVSSPIIAGDLARRVRDGPGRSS